MPQLQGHWTVADVWALPEDGKRYEVIDGELFVTPAPALRHQAAVLHLAALLHAYAQRTSIGYVFVAPADITFSAHRNVQPDVFILPAFDGRRPDNFSQVNRVIFAGEVLSPSTARTDRVEKRALFRDQAVSEYWIIDLDNRVIERSTPERTELEIISDTIVWCPAGSREHFTMDVQAYFRSVLDD